jgi:regulator of cell morphogenesis and NO signaling
MTFETSNTVREIAHQLPSSIRVFEDLGIDYCCGGNKSIAQACHSAGVAVELLLGRLGELSDTVPDADFASWHEAPLSELTRHIVEAHHAKVRKEIPRLNALLEKVNSRHGNVHPELTPMKLVFAFVGEDMLNHMQKEEQVLFPYINRLECASNEGTLPGPTPFGSVTRPVECMMRDHEKAGKEMQQIRNLSNAYTLPDGACLSYRALYDGLRDFEQDLHRHVYLENNILFPRAIELESKACTPA